MPLHQGYANAPSHKFTAARYAYVILFAYHANFPAMSTPRAMLPSSRAYGSAKILSPIRHSGFSPSITYRAMPEISTLSGLLVCSFCLIIILCFRKRQYRRSVERAFIFMRFQTETHYQRCCFPQPSLIEETASTDRQLPVDAFN